MNDILDVAELGGTFDDRVDDFQLNQLIAAGAATTLPATPLNGKTFVIADVLTINAAGAVADYTAVAVSAADFERFRSEMMQVVTALQGKIDEILATTDATC